VGEVGDSVCVPPRSYLLAVPRGVDTELYLDGAYDWCEVTSHGAHVRSFLRGERKEPIAPSPSPRVQVVVCPPYEPTAADVAWWAENGARDERRENGTT
jgi:hypothetical protein